MATDTFVNLSVDLASYSKTSKTNDNYTIFTPNSHIEIDKILKVNFHFVFSHLIR